MVESLCQTVLLQKHWKGQGLSKGPACSTPSLWRPSPHSSYGTVLQDVTCQIPWMAVRCKGNKHEEEKSHYTSQLL